MPSPPSASAFMVAYISGLADMPSAPTPPKIKTKGVLGPATIMPKGTLAGKVNPREPKKRRTPVIGNPHKAPNANQRECPICGDKFTPRTYRQRYCRKRAKCIIQYHTSYWDRRGDKKKWYRTRWKKSSGPRPIRHCAKEGCSTPFVPISLRQVYCLDHSRSVRVNRFGRTKLSQAKFNVLFDKIRSAVAEVGAELSRIAESKYHTLEEKIACNERWKSLLTAQAELSTQGATPSTMEDRAFIQNAILKRRQSRSGRRRSIYQPSGRRIVIAEPLAE